MGQELGLRELKKHKTRQLISDTARELFARRGFENVSVAEIARAAEVSETTVFNYFPTKEDLVFYGLEAFEQQLLQAVRDRPPGEGILQAFGQFILQPRGLLAAADPASAEALLSVSRTIAASPALAAREQQVLARYADSLAALLAEETGASFPLLCDTDKVVAKAYGVLSFTRLFANRVTFVIDKDGIIRHIEEGGVAIDHSGALHSCSLPGKK